MMSTQGGASAILRKNFPTFESFELAPRRTQRSVLIVEDDPWIEPVLSRGVREAMPNYDVKLDWVSTVESAKSKLWDGSYVMVIADVLLNDDQDGLELWHYCQKYFPEMPVLLISSLSFEAFFRRVGREDCPAFLPKPFQVGECRQMVRGLAEYVGESA